MAKESATDVLASEATPFPALTLMNKHSHTFFYLALSVFLCGPLGCGKETKGLEETVMRARPPVPALSRRPRVQHRLARLWP